MASSTILVLIFALIGRQCSGKDPVESLFKPPSKPAIPSRVCINMGSTEEAVGPYIPETKSLTFPFGVTGKRVIKKMGKGFAYQRAFQVQRTHPKALEFYVYVDERFRYNIQLGFYDTTSECKKGAVVMDVTVGASPDEKLVERFRRDRTISCSKPYFIQFNHVITDAWDRIRVKVSGTPRASLATACFEKDYSTLSQRKGTLYADADDEVEVFLNGKSLFYVESCFGLGTATVSLKYGDVISAVVKNYYQGGSLRMVFMSDGRKWFSTGLDGWKYRIAFSSFAARDGWMLPEYADDDWPNARTTDRGCTSPDFPTDADKIWAEHEVAELTLFFRYKYLF